MATSHGHGIAYSPANESAITNLDSHRPVACRRTFIIDDSTSTIHNRPTRSGRHLRGHRTASLGGYIPPLSRYLAISPTTGAGMGKYYDWQQFFGSTVISAQPRHGIDCRVSFGQWCGECLVSQYTNDRDYDFKNGRNRSSPLSNNSKITRATRAWRVHPAAIEANEHLLRIADYVGSYH